jgi:hypothetical protein
MFVKMMDMCGLLGLFTYFCVTLTDILLFLLLIFIALMRLVVLVSAGQIPAYIHTYMCIGSILGGGGNPPKKIGGGEGVCKYPKHFGDRSSEAPPPMHPLCTCMPQNCENVCKTEI